jgi:gliding motility-associated-like protein
MKKQIFNLIFLCFALPMSAQTPFQKSLSVYLDTTLIRASPDGQSVYVVGTTKANGTLTLSIFRLNNVGTTLWHRQYFGNAVGLVAKSIETVRDGLLVLLSDNPTDSRGDCYLMKLNTDGSLAWSRQMGQKNLTRGVEIKKDAADNFWLSGEHISLVSTDSAYSFLAQFDANGTLLYSRKNVNHYFFTSGEEVYRVTDLVWNPKLSRFFMVEDFDVPYAASAISGPSRGRYNLGSFGQIGDEQDWFLDVHIAKMVGTKTHIAIGGWTLETGTLGRDKPAIGLLNYEGKKLDKVRPTKTIQLPIHSQSGDIIFYDPDEKTLIKYDTTLTPIWTKKYDNCTVTKAFSADIAVDGSIYSARNISGKTVVSRALPTGALAVCSDYTKPSVVLSTFTNFYTIIGNFKGYGYYSLPFPIRDTALQVNLLPAESADYCFKLDAAFDIPDTICLGTTVKAANVDTTINLSHEWFVKGQWNTQIQQNVDYPSVGRYKIFHSLENSFCKDTASRYVTVIAAPKIALTDTIVCGSPKLTVNLTDNFAERYFLNGAITPPIFDIIKAGVYAIRVENARCKIEKNIKIKVVDFPAPIKPVDSIYCSNTPFSTVLTGAFENIFWDNKPIKDTFFIRDAAKHSYRATYSLDKDCIVKGEFSILRKSCGGSSIPDIVFVPNVFSPNGDNTNDVFQAYPTKDAEVVSVMIYNRWGDLVFKSTDTLKGWNGLVNGTTVAPDVYVYAVQYRDKRTDKVFVLSGGVTLLK